MGFDRQKGKRGAYIHEEFGLKNMRRGLKKRKKKCGKEKKKEKEGGGKEENLDNSYYLVRSRHFSFLTVLAEGGKETIPVLFPF